MRKVLLATTALVAMSVSAAQAADISISGNLEFEFVSRDAGDSMHTDGNVVIDASMTADSGVTYGVTTSSGIHTGTVEAAYISVSSADLGTLYLGNIDDDAPGAMDGALGQNNDIESERHSSGTATNETHSWRTAIGGGGDQATWISPSLGGLKVGVSSDATNDTTAMALTYSIGGTSIYFGSNENQQNMGVKTSIAGFTIAAGSRRTDGTSNKAADIAVKYAMDNGITVAALNARGTTTGNVKQTYNNYGASYAVAPGVAAKIESGDANGDTFTWLSMEVKF